MLMQRFTLFSINYIKIIGPAPLRTSVSCLVVPGFPEQIFIIDSVFLALQACLIRKLLVWIVGLMPSYTWIALLRRSVRQSFCPSVRLVASDKQRQLCFHYSLSSKLHFPRLEVTATSLLGRDLSGNCVATVANHKDL